MYGVANLISKHERGENWHYTVNYTGKANSVTDSVVIWNFEFCVAAEIFMLHGQLHG